MSTTKPTFDTEPSSAKELHGHSILCNTLLVSLCIKL